MTIDMVSQFSLATRRCNTCGDHNVGTLFTSPDGQDFACANCDPDNFQLVSEAQKEAYLAGDFDPNYSC